MKKLFKKLTKKNNSELKQELIFAHIIIALLSLVSIVLLALGATLTISFNNKLSAIAAALIAVLALISLAMSVVYSRSK